MAHAAWITVSTVWCDKVEAKADLMEYRIYPNEILPDFPGYQVSARNCSQSIACNLDSIACKWAFTNPDTDPFVT